MLSTKRHRKCDARAYRNDKNDTSQLTDIQTKRSGHTKIVTTETQLLDYHTQNHRQCADFRISSALHLLNSYTASKSPAPLQ